MVKKLNAAATKKKRGRKPKSFKDAEPSEDTDRADSVGDSVSVTSTVDNIEESVKLKKKFGKFRFLSLDQNDIEDSTSNTDADNGNPIKTEICEDLETKMDNLNVDYKLEESSPDVEEADPDESTSNCENHILFSDDNDSKSIRRSARLQTKSKQIKPILRKPKEKAERNISYEQAENDQSFDNCDFSEMIEMPEEKAFIKVKSRWRQSCEQEMTCLSQKNEPTNSESSFSTTTNNSGSQNNGTTTKNKISLLDYHQMKRFNTIRENQYLTEKILCKEINEMVCDCFISKEEIESGELGCGEDCINRLLMIECGASCSLGDLCSNKRFQKCQNAPCVVFDTEKKGLGLKTMKTLASGDFIMEYVGEVINNKQLEKRALQYSQENHQHYYLMALRNDMIIDATSKGNVSRYINHSCEPNCETQKWTVNGELRIGFFAKKSISYNEEITFDYQFQRYGKQAQKCYCETASCRGWIGEEPYDDESDDEDEDEDDEIDEAEVEVEVEVEEYDNEGVKDYATVNKAKLKDKKGSDSSTLTSSADLSVKAEVPPPKRKRKYTKKPTVIKPVKNVIVDDLDLEESIRILNLTGLKNQAHTLRLSRLMIRAADFESRRQLLCLIRNGEMPCRRLFLDYHGLRLIHSWMEDIVNQPITYPLRIEILQTLASLPIPNKSMIKDSKVLSTVTTWSQFTMDNIVKNSTIEEDEEEQKYFLDELVKTAEKLIDDWSQLKEVFRIPKKDRIEQMKEHEREANEGMNEEKSENIIRSSFEFVNQQPHKDRRRWKNAIMNDSNFNSYYSLLSKEARRKLFARKVAREEENARRIAEKAKATANKTNTVNQYVEPLIDPCMWSTSPVDNTQFIQKLKNDVLNCRPNSKKNLNCKPNNMPLPLSIDFSVPPPNILRANAQSQLHHQPQLQLNLAPNGSQMSNHFNAVHQMTPSFGPLVAQPQPQAQNQVTSQFFHMPAPMRLPNKWKCAFDKFGRPYYYHTKIRKAQWQPPDIDKNQESNVLSDETTSSSEVSSLSSESSSDSDSDLLVEIQKKIGMIKASRKKQLEDSENSDPISKKKRDSLVQEHLISPLSQEEKLSYSIEANRYKHTKEKLKRHKEKHRKLKKLFKTECITSPNSNDNSVVSSTGPSTPPSTGGVTTHPHSSSSSKSKSKSVSLSSFVGEEAKKIKEVFRCQMATEMVQFLNPYRRNDCKLGRITNNEDFKHLARKLTHFVMIKELKHCRKIEDLVCNDSVKLKAKEFIRKYMLKFGETYVRPTDELDDSKND